MFRFNKKKLPRGEQSPEDKITDAVFLQAFILRTLDHVKNVEEDVKLITSGEDTGDLYYQTITGLKEALSNVHQHSRDQKSQCAPEGHSNSVESESESEPDEDEDYSSDSEGREPQAPIDKKAARKENKKKVKEEKRETRKTKVPKAVKKKKKKLAKAHKTR